VSAHLGLQSASVAPCHKQKIFYFAFHICKTTATLCNLPLFCSQESPADTADTVSTATTDSSPPHAAAAAAEHRWKGAVPSSPAPVGVWGRSPDLGVGWKCVSDASAVTEVHLRRLDAADQLHRRVVAVLTVDATPEEVRKNLLIACLL